MRKVLKWMWESHKSQYPHTIGDWIAFSLIFAAMTLLLINTLGR